MNSIVSLNGAHEFVCDPELIEWRDRQRYLAAYREGDRVIALAPEVFTTAIVDGTLDSITARYQFTDFVAASFALSVWLLHGAEGEPVGWVRESLSGRRRADGDPTREVVRP